jgi:hypothetical protein
LRNRARILGADEPLSRAHTVVHDCGLLLADPVQGYDHKQLLPIRDHMREVEASGAPCSPVDGATPVADTARGWAAGIPAELLAR